MALSRRNGFVRTYDEKECFDLYMSWGAGGSYKKMIAWHWENKGVRASPMGPYWALWRWAMKNPELTYPQYKRWYFETASAGRNVVIDPNASFRDYLEEIKHHLRHRCASSRREYAQFLQKYGL